MGLQISVFQAVFAVLVIIGLGLLWANAAKGVDRPTRITDVDKDGAGDVDPKEKEATVQAFEEEQARRHPED
ncbi:hypothetical protein BZG35_05770 [Brevundimonas sp. LM2]|uniref:hypothetical protein n=1 Tax=Brevundimonas sp. LM2 TaxID=1938605 RepID=UPI000983C18B|nr:hypothetical protein [Brevundimonas sp. LM2]AQR61212.1 hypothetical protein BZG35_05770 [Brevundimonas sp. LM2]